jgi:2-polyprenyl-3-methyl-5-hydroxy-6-metoxy-1,4-benzoquinol methylase
VTLHGNSPVDIFDVGCGCGYLLKAAEDMGMCASGNDLNGYAVDRMRALFGFDVHLGVLYDLINQGSIKEGAFDIVYMNDYIEHSYHPMADIDATYKMLRNDGIVYLQTFCIDSDMFDRLGKEWDMLMWNHCFHFSTDSLSKMVEKAGFEVIEVSVDRDKVMVEICGRKNST